MRRILFRGKACGSGKWVLGSLLDRFKSGVYIALLNCGGSNLVEVDPETVGQFTGLTDKKQTMIFEGDIIEQTRHVGKPITSLLEVRYSIDQARFLAYYSNGVFDPTAFHDCEIVGNIFDNRELIRGDGDE